MKLITFTVFLALTSNVFASTITCESRNYSIKVEDSQFANYSINGKANVGADVEVEHSYNSDRLTAFGLKVDGVSNAIEVITIKNSAGKFEGTLFFKKVSQTAICIKK